MSDLAYLCIVGIIVALAALAQERPVELIPITSVEQVQFHPDDNSYTLNAKVVYRDGCHSPLSQSGRTLDDEAIVYLYHQTIVHRRICLQAEIEKEVKFVLAGIPDPLYAVKDRLTGRLLLGSLQ